jgi:hypothetical protein
LVSRGIFVAVVWRAVCDARTGGEVVEIGERVSSAELDADGAAMARARRVPISRMAC